MIFILCWCYNPGLVGCSNCSSFATGSSFIFFFLELQDVLGSSITHLSTEIWELGMLITLRMSLLLGILGQSWVIHILYHVYTFWLFYPKLLFNFFIMCFINYLKKLMKEVLLGSDCCWPLLFLGLLLSICSFFILLN